MDEAELILEAQRGDLDSFNRLVLAYQTQVYNLAYRIFGDANSAADAAQEAFLAAYRGLKAFRGGSFRSWLLRIVTNICYDELRGGKRRPAASLEAISNRKSIWKTMAPRSAPRARCGRKRPWSRPSFRKRSRIASTASRTIFAWWSSWPTCRDTTTPRFRPWPPYPWEP